MDLYSLYFVGRNPFVSWVMGFLFPLLDDDDRPANSAETIESDIFIRAVERVLPNLPKRLSFLFLYPSFAQSCSMIL